LNYKQLLDAEDRAPGSDALKAAAAAPSAGVIGPYQSADQGQDHQEADDHWVDPRHRRGGWALSGRIVQA